MDALENMRVEELHSKLSCSWMKGKGRFARMGVQGDGSCFFHSVCALTNLDGYLAASPSKQKSIAYKFRCDFSTKFSKNEYERLSAKSSSPKSYDEEHDGFCSPKVWADEVMIRHASKVLDLNLIFLDLENDKAYCGVHGEDAEGDMKRNVRIRQKTALIAWVGRRHFEPIVRVDNAEEGLLTTVFDPKEDSELINSIMGTYKDECRL